MADLVLRNITRADYEPIKSLINATWKIDTFIGDQKLLNRILNIYLRSCLLQSTFGMVAVKDGDIVGIILGRAKGEKRCYGFFTHILATLFNSFLIPLSPKSEKNKVHQYSQVFMAYRELMADKKNSFDGEVVFFAVKKEFQGLGIGKCLLSSLMDYFKSRSVELIYVYTDTCCNYGFYDSQGFLLTGKKDISLEIMPGPLGLTVFLYIFFFDGEDAAEGGKRQKD